MKDNLSTNHSDLRKMMRVGSDKSMTELWDEGFDCEVKGRHYDEASYNVIEGVVLLKNDGTVSTILRDTGEDITITEADRNT